MAAQINSQLEIGALVALSFEPLTLDDLQTRWRRQHEQGIKIIPESCRAIFNFAIKRRHLSPDAENPFLVIELDRIPILRATVSRAFVVSAGPELFPAP